MKTERLHHLDALRALTMLLILPGHALALVGLRGGWNDLESATYWTIHVFRLPLFFIVAGFFAALLVTTRGTGSFLRNRAVRIWIPFAVCLVAVVPLVTLELQALSEQPHRAGAEGLGAFADPHPSFLWFLWYLTLIYAATLLARWALRPIPAPRQWLVRHGRLLGHWSAPLLLALPTALLLYRQPTWLAIAPSESFVPRLDLLGYYAIFFVTGWLLYATPGLRETIEGKHRSYLAIAAVALPPALALYLLQSEPAIGTSKAFHVLALFLLSISTWTLAFGLLGLARRFCHAANSRLRYWTDAAYWIYLSHFVVMGALALAVVDLPMPEVVRVIILAGFTLAMIFPAYGLFVRHTAIGRVLHGPRPQAPERRQSRRQLTRPAAVAGRRA
ncbi:MAG TPA: acyltransferase family protein [Solirubrobacterales bacterium]|nr:acyltransferase family protein [Solirubrobacterales bacterium]